MKLFCLLACLFILPSCAQAAELEVPHVAVHGTAVREVVPDEMIWSLRATTRGVDVQTVAKDHSVLMDQVLKFLKSSGIEENKTQTSSMRLAEDWEYQKQTRVKKGYYASTTISFKSTDLDNYQKLWIGISKIDHVEVGWVSFDHTDRIAIRGEMRIEAVHAAREKARELAQALDARIGAPFAINEISAGDDVKSPAYANRMRAADFASGRAAEGNAIAPGTIPIRARVDVIFRLLSD